MNSKMEELYIAPQVEIVEVRVEKGFAVSEIPIDGRDEWD